MNPRVTNAVEAIHAVGVPLVIAITGGGTSAIAQLLAIPGGSRVVMEGAVPYHERALAEWLGGIPYSACSGPTASAMAMASYRRAQRLAGHDSVAGIGVTASLISSRPKRGEHRIHAAWQTRQASGLVSLVLEKGRRDREGEELVATELALLAVAEGVGADSTIAPSLVEPERIERRVVTAPQEWQRLLAEEEAMHPVGFDPNERPLAILPGSFHPLHDGHRGMARVARERLGCRVVWELSVANVDKPPLDYLAIADRTSQFGPEAHMLTRAPTFVAKGRLLPGVTFVVGADTIERVGETRYYGEEHALRDAAIDELAELGCRFLVFGRQVDDRFQTLDELNLPPRLRDLCQGVGEQEFRHDISSTAIREEWAY